MLSIRLTRVGKRKDARFRIIVQEKAKSPFSSYLEILGQYNPHAESRVTNLNTERIRYWLAQGAKLTATVHNIFVEHNLVTGKKIDLGRLKKKKTVSEKEDEAVKAVAVKAVKEQPIKAKVAPKEESASGVPAQKEAPAPSVSRDEKPAQGR